MEELPLIGKSTEEAMKSGVINGINGEMETFIDLYGKLFPDLKVIMCGGEAKFFESSLKASIFAVPELVLIGLNRILEYNG
jgi:type III pantothenate kinase